MGGITETIIVAILGSNALFGFITFLITRKDRKHKEIDAIMEHVDKNSKTLAVVSYMMLADKLEHRIEKGFATKAHRREMKLLFDNYRNNGWNGDMEDLMDKFYDLPLEPPKKFDVKLP